METVSRDENLLAEKKLLSALNNLPPLPDISKHFCAKNAKILAVFSVIGFIIYHSVLLETLGKNLKVFLHHHLHQENDCYQWHIIIQLGCYKCSGGLCGYVGLLMSLLSVVFCHMSD